MKKPSAPRIGAIAVMSPNETLVAGLETTIPALLSAINAKKRPIPAEIPTRRDIGIELIIHSRILKILKKMKITPDTKTAARATCHV